MSSKLRTVLLILIAANAAAAQRSGGFGRGLPPAPRVDWHPTAGATPLPDGTYEVQAGVAFGVEITTNFNEGRVYLLGMIAGPDELDRFNLGAASLLLWAPCNSHHLVQAEMHVPVEFTGLSLLAVAYAQTRGGLIESALHVLRLAA